MSVGVDCNDVEADSAVRESRVFRQKQCRGAYDFALLVVIDCMTGACESVRGAISNFDKYETVVVAHNKVDFAQATAVISGNLPQTVF